MRLGILANLAVICVISGFLLFIVFTASLERAILDETIQQATLLADLLENRILSARSPGDLWKTVRLLCRADSGMRPLLYDARGSVLGGCSVDVDLEKPDPRTFGRRIRVVGGELPRSLIKGAVVVVDITRDFPLEVRSVRGFVEVQPSVFTRSWKFFAAYLLLTQGALFFLGYLLFHRTVIGPIKTVAELAGKASGLTDFHELSDSGHFKEDIGRISSSLKIMITKIVEDRAILEDLISRLRQSNIELESAQQGLIRSEKMAVVGRLAAGLAHEIGNPLQIVMGYLELLQRGPDPESAADILSRMDSELKRIHNTLARLLEFARPLRENVKRCNINEVVKDSGTLLKGRQGLRNIELVHSLDEDLPLVATEPEKIRQILVNLIFNAVDAIPQSGGKIILRTRRHGDSVQIEVEDSGSGIAGENLEKVFDPFFTTKEPGKGTGLGLTVCQALAASLGGSVDIISAEGKGACVVVALPIGEDEE